MSSLTRRAGPLLLGAILIAVVFVVPYWFPSKSALLSASALAGFNNGLAYNLYVPVLGLLGFLLARLVRDPRAFAPAAANQPLFHAPPLALLLLIAAHVALFVALYLQRGAFVFAEALYFEDAAYRLNAGQRPFVDFNFFYGPLFVFPTAVLGRLMGIPLAYALFYVAAYVAGVYLLYVVIAHMVQARRAAVAWTTLLSIAFFNPITGLNYTFGRFLFPIVSLFAIWQCSVAFTVGRWTASVVVMTLAILCSPDIAAVTVVGAGVLIVLTGLKGLPEGRLDVPARLVAIPFVALGASALPLLALDGSAAAVVAYLKPIATFSGGGWSTPIDPSVPMLSALGVTVLAAAVLAAAWMGADSAALRPLVAALAVTIVLMERAIFGKADVLHIAYSGLPAFIVAASWATWQGSRRIVAAVAAALVVGVAFPLQFYHAMLFAPSLLARITTGPVAHAAAPAPPAASKEDIQASLSKAVDHFGAGRLYYMHRLEYYRLPIYLQRDLEPFLFHPSLTSAFTRQDIDDVIAELTRGEAVVLARRADLSLSAPKPLPLHWAYYLTSAPLPGSEVFNLTMEFQWRLEKPLVEFLTTAYDAVFEDGEVVGLQLRKSVAARAHAVQ